MFTTATCTVQWDSSIMMLSMHNRCASRQVIDIFFSCCGNCCCRYWCSARYLQLAADESTISGDSIQVNDGVIDKQRGMRNLGVWIARSDVIDVVISDVTRDVCYDVIMPYNQASHWRTDLRSTKVMQPVIILTLVNSDTLLFTKKVAFRLRMPSVYTCVGCPKSEWTRMLDVTNNLN